LENPQKACKLQNKFFSKNSVKKIEKHTLAYVGPGNMVGEEDIIAYPLNTNSYSTTVKCISQDANLVYMLRDDFNKL
jgi:CRP-like cAMP-binding protein